MPGGGPSTDPRPGTGTETVPEARTARRRIRPGAGARPGVGSGSKPDQKRIRSGSERARGGSSARRRKPNRLPSLPSAAQLDRERAASLATRVAASATARSSAAACFSSAVFSAFSGETNR